MRPPKMEYQPRLLALIMAGGKGSRLYPLTRDRAKPEFWRGQRPPEVIAVVVLVAVIVLVVVLLLR